MAEENDTIISQYGSIYDGYKINHYSIKLDPNNYTFDEEKLKSMNLIFLNRKNFLYMQVLLLEVQVLC